MTTLTGPLAHVFTGSNAELWLALTMAVILVAAAFIDLFVSETDDSPAFMFGSIIVAGALAETALFHLYFPHNTNMVAIAGVAGFIVLGGSISDLLKGQFISATLLAISASILELIAANASTAGGIGSVQPGLSWAITFLAITLAAQLLRHAFRAAVNYRDQRNFEKRQTTKRASDRAAYAALDPNL